MRDTAPVGADRRQSAPGAQPCREPLVARPLLCGDLLPGIHGLPARAGDRRHDQPTAH